ncbi:LytTR family DNA-binding domain-containing protein [Marivirga sp.]|uniref:LytR/AlgR family response regulator transcription factor n=1 Tax=Marivirga sp. TaxID=2018662 RepID=UPI002D7F9B6B|nr:LytTR family DNA-binding domain-containing protein [Marivirga sp.]HET8859363.1 LytTR family DNA-binding domain-containing protein [Marivirga sp.]
MKIRCMLVDDEPPALQVLKTHISAFPNLEVVAECANAINAFQVLQQQTIDLLFLDIQMPQLLGTDFIKSLRHPPKVIFTTAHREYALDGYELDAIDYLLKPISFERFMKAVQKVIRQDLSSNVSPNSKQLNKELPASEEAYYYFRVDRKMVKVRLNEIYYIESLKDYVKIFTAAKVLIVKQTMQALEQMLPEEKFLRIHRSYMVSVDKIQSFSQNHLEVKEKELPIGRLYKLEVQRKLE